MSQLVNRTKESKRDLIRNAGFDTNQTGCQCWKRSRRQGVPADTSAWPAAWLEGSHVRAPPAPLQEDTGKTSSEPGGGTKAGQLLGAEMKCRVPVGRAEAAAGGGNVLQAAPVEPAPRVLKASLENQRKGSKSQEPLSANLTLMLVCV